MAAKLPPRTLGKLGNSAYGRCNSFLNVVETFCESGMYGVWGASLLHKHRQVSTSYGMSSDLLILIEGKWPSSVM